MSTKSSSSLIESTIIIRPIGEAVDIKPYGSTTYNRLLEHIHNYSGSTHVFDQLILYPTFIHISFGDRNRHQIIDKRK
jgi:hypothetical protein